MKYTNLHQHSHYSNHNMLDAYGTIKQIVSQCKEIGYSSVCLTDHGNVSGHIDLIRECKSAGLKPICGCEMYATDDIEMMKKVREKIPLNDKDLGESDENQKYEEDAKAKAKQKMHFNVLAKNQKGLISLWELVSESWEDGFYYKPTTDWERLASKKDNLLFGTACEVGPLGRGMDKIKYEGIKNGKTEDEWMKEALEFTIKRLQLLKDLFGDSLYVEIIPIPEDRARWKYLISYKAAKALNVLVLATNDSHAPKKEDTKYQDMLYCAGQYRTNKEALYHSKERNRYTQELFYIHSAEEMFERMKETFPEIEEKDITELIENTEKIVEQIEEVHEPKVPAVAYSDINDTKDNKLNLYKDIQKKIKDGWKFRNLDELDSEKKEIYIKRLERELEVVLNKGYIDYFLIMQDIMDWCETDRPLIENYDLWYSLNGQAYPEKSKEEIYEILKNDGYFDKKETIGTGIARGSAGGSLLTYLLRITNIDPIPGELLFERFIDYTRGNVYYNPDFTNYPKSSFLKDFPSEEENKSEYLILKEKWTKKIKEAIPLFLKENPWFDEKQINREFWLLEHNQKFTREEEYFLTLCEKIEKGEITEKDTQNNVNSIFAYIVGITEKLSKDDFIVNLTDIPDIDSDFEDKRRNEVYKYLQNRYGIHNSARIATYTVLKDKSAIDLLGRIFGVNMNILKTLKEELENYKKENDISELKSLKGNEFIDFHKNYLNGTLRDIELLNYVPALLDQIVATGMHAAGIIVHNKKMSNYGAIYQNVDKETKERVPVLCWDSRVAESMGLMKLDILGLNTVTNLKEINKLVKERKGFDHHWQRIPGLFEDIKTKELIKDANNWTGLFQLEGFTMTLLGKEVKPKDFEEVIFTVSGGRPGPLEEAMKFGKIKSGQIKPYYYKNDIYKKITEKRGGILIYQEDIMQVAWQLCGYDDAMVGKIRKFISKSKKEDLENLRPGFIKRLIENGGFEEKEAEALWISMENFGRYAFNKAHSEAYALLAYIQAYYKANYPLEFYAGMVQTLGKVSGKVVGTNKDKIYFLLKDFESKGYKVLFPSINGSEKNFKIDKDSKTGIEGIRVGYDYITGIGDKKAKQIEENRPYKSYEDFVQRSGANTKIVNICKQLGMFNELGGAPDIDEKILPDLMLLKEVSSIINIINYLLGLDKIHIKKLRIIYEKIGLSEKIIESYLLKKNDIENKIDVEDILKIKSLLTRKIKSLSNKFKKGEIKDGKEKEAGKLFTGDENKQNEILEKKEELDLILEDFKLQSKFFSKNNIYSFENSDNKIIQSFRNKIWSKSEELKLQNMSCCIDGKVSEFINLKEILSDVLKEYKKYFDELYENLGLSSEKVIIKPKYKTLITLCPILAQASLTKYSPIFPLLQNYLSIKNIDYNNDYYNATIAGIITSKRSLPDNDNPKKMKMSLSIRLNGEERTVFVNGGAYNSNSEVLNKVEPGDPVLILGNVTKGFEMIQLAQIDFIEPLYKTVMKIKFVRKRKKELLEKKERTKEEENYIEKVSQIDIRNLFTFRELNYLKI